LALSGEPFTVSGAIDKNPKITPPVMYMKMLKSDENDSQATTTPSKKSKSPFNKRSIDRKNLNVEFDKNG
jgi:hypothetical protein